MSALFSMSLSPVSQAIRVALIAAALPCSAFAADILDDESKKIEHIEVKGEAQSYKVEAISTATKTNTPLRDIPQAITVLTEEQIDDQAMQNMADVVRYVPGVQMAQGEGHRDAPIFRGNTSTADFYINGMRDDVHIRLMVTRGIKRTPYQDPRVVVSPATIVIIAEYKDPLPATIEKGIRLATVHVRRGYPDVQDPRWNSHSKLNCITACIQATQAGADEALMLDPHGFVATCNSTHFFIVRRGEVWTSTGDYCLHGVTRANVLQVCREAGIPAREKNFSLTEAYSAEEAFCTGTFAGVVPVREIDGRTIGDGRPGPMVARLQALYRELVQRDVLVRAGEKLA